MVLILLDVQELCVNYFITVIDRSVGLESGSDNIIGCARIQRVYVSSRAVSVRTDRDIMLR